MYIQNLHIEKYVIMYTHLRQEKKTRTDVLGLLVLRTPVLHPFRTQWKGNISKSKLRSSRISDTLQMNGISFCVYSRELIIAEWPYFMLLCILLIFMTLYEPNYALQIIYECSHSFVIVEFDCSIVKCTKITNS